MKICNLNDIDRVGKRITDGYKELKILYGVLRDAQQIFYEKYLRINIVKLSKLYYAYIVKD